MHKGWVERQEQKRLLVEAKAEEARKEAEYRRTWRAREKTEKKPCTGCGAPISWYYRGKECHTCRITSKTATNSVLKHCYWCTNWFRGIKCSECGTVYNEKKAYTAQRRTSKSYWDIVEDNLRKQGKTGLELKNAIQKLKHPTWEIEAPEENKDDLGALNCL